MSDIQELFQLFYIPVKIYLFREDFLSWHIFSSLSV